MAVAICNGDAVMVARLLVVSKNKKKKPNHNNQTGEQNQNQNQNEKENENENENQNQEENNTNADEKRDENADEKGDEKGKESKSDKQNTGVIVLGVHLHCQGCVETVVKSLRGFDGVEEIEPNAKDSKVTVKGKSADPVKVAERVRRKTGKPVELISPKPKKEADKKDKDKKSEKKPEAPKVIETVLKIHLHCGGCAKEVKHCILKMHGVQTVNADINTSHVTVKGAFDPKNLIAHISKRAGRHAEVVNPKNKQNKNKDKDNNNDGEPNEKNDENPNEKNKQNKKKHEGSPYPDFPSEVVYAPQLFSDENANGCSIM
uniref:heavy metal-associated isoprenylated plant protein 8-like n=1 Tax=Erigeron canadensis TaxID=72917 RepID=UPI001CB90FE0|nr:heavy metal-associated isoprenylated plant protein 8-like [Erigeron canadensis]